MDSLFIRRSDASGQSAKGLHSSCVNLQFYDDEFNKEVSSYELR